MTMSSRLAVMHAGRIVQVGTPTDVYEFPANRMVGEFIGSINVFEGKVVEAEGGHTDVLSDGGEGVIRLESTITGLPDSVIAVGIRPEKMRIHRADQVPAPDGPPVNRLTGRIEEIAYLGDLSIFHVRVPNGRRVQVSRANATRRRDDPLTWEDQVVVDWDATVPVVLHQ